MRRTSHLAALRGMPNKTNVRTLRSRMTDAETRLWYRLRAARFGGWKFRRQVPLGCFVVDFLCEEARVIVEVDGGQHDERREQDAARTAWLEAQGYVVVRYWNNDVMENIDGLLGTLSRTLARRR